MLIIPNNIQPMLLTRRKVSKLPPPHTQRPEGVQGGVVLSQGQDWYLVFCLFSIIFLSSDNSTVRPFYLGGATYCLCPEWPGDSGWPTTPPHHCHSAWVTDRYGTHISQSDTVVTDHWERNVSVWLGNSWR